MALMWPAGADVTSHAARCIYKRKYGIYTYRHVCINSEVVVELKQTTLWPSACFIHCLHLILPRPASSDEELWCLSHFNDVKLGWNATWPFRLMPLWKHQLCIRFRTTYWSGPNWNWKKLDSMWVMLLTLSWKISDLRHMSKNQIWATFEMQSERSIQYVALNQKHIWWFSKRP